MPCSGSIWSWPWRDGRRCLHWCGRGRTWSPGAWRNPGPSPCRWGAMKNEDPWRSRLKWCKSHSPFSNPSYTFLRGRSETTSPGCWLSWLLLRAVVDMVLPISMRVAVCWSWAPPFPSVNCDHPIFPKHCQSPKFQDFDSLTMLQEGIYLSCYHLKTQLARLVEVLWDHPILRLLCQISRFPHICQIKARNYMWNPNSDPSFFTLAFT